MNPRAAGGEIDLAGTDLVERLEHLAEIGAGVGGVGLVDRHGAADQPDLGQERADVGGQELRPISHDVEDVAEHGGMQAIADQGDCFGVEGRFRHCVGLGKI